MNLDAQILEKVVKNIHRIMRESINVKRLKINEFVQNELFEFFRAEGFVVEKNYKIKFLSHYRTGKKKGIINVSRGLIDNYAAPYDIAVEFDSGKFIKWKSLEKLIQCNAGCCIGIVFGSKNEETNIKKSLDRIKAVSKETLNFKKNREYFGERIQNMKFFLGVISLDFLELVNLKKLLNHDLSKSNIKDFFM